MLDDRPLGVYVHVPFCRRRCAYCDFAIAVGALDQAAAFEDAVGREVAAFATRRGRRPVDTIHFGGGTPSLVDPSVIERLAAVVRAHLAVAPGSEIALEANPEDLAPEKIGAWRAAGVTRLTVGLQALDDRGLEGIGRVAGADQHLAALARAAEAGFASLGVDIIFGRPGQTVADWRREVRRVAALPVHHVSLYALETDGRTPLVSRIERGLAPRPDPDTAAAMYEESVAVMAAAGFERYEISNFALPGHASRHNGKYWQDDPYAGFGPAAASYVDGERWTNPRRLAGYLALARGAAPSPVVEPYDADRRAGEALVFGLRCPCGVDLAWIAERHGATALERRADAIRSACKAGLLVQEGSRLRLADSAFLIADEALALLL